MPDTSSPSPDDDVLLRRPPPPQTWRERVERLADATGTTPLRIAIGGVAVAACALAALWLLRPPPSPPEVALPFASTTASTAPTTSTTAPEVLVVHVAGSVVAPGIHELAVGARVVDAIEAAGGLTAEADAGRINLAAPLTDGERVYVLALGEEAPPVAVGTAPGGAASAESAGPVNINTADAAALEALPGVGPATSEAIL